MARQLSSRIGPSIPHHILLAFIFLFPFQHFRSFFYLFLFCRRCCCGLFIIIGRFQMATFIFFNLHQAAGSGIIIFPFAMLYTVLFCLYDLVFNNFIVAFAINRNGIIRCVGVIPTPAFFPYQIAQVSIVLLNSILATQFIYFYSNNITR